MTGGDIVIAGSGNVATHLGMALKNAGYKILTIYSRNESTAAELAGKLGCEYTNRINEIPAEASFYIFAVSDDALPGLIENFPHKNIFSIHTSGSTHLNILSKLGSQHGVLYPLQTLSKNHPIDFSCVPLYIEASGNDSLNTIHEMASRLSKHVIHITSEQRMTLHVGAVFACNFTNHLWAVAFNLLKQNDLEFEALIPLMHETLKKALAGNPTDSQTGPAIRNDQSIINRHKQLLKSLPAYEKIYTFMTQSIQENTKK